MPRRKNPSKAIEEIESSIKRPKQSLKTGNATFFFKEAPKRDEFGVIHYGEAKPRNRSTTQKQQELQPQTSETGHIQPHTSETGHIEILKNNGFLDDISEEISHFNYDKIQPSVSWGERRQKESVQWNEKRQSMFSAFLHNEYIDGKCHLCNTNKAIISCYDCCPLVHFCELCDEVQHKSVLHDRKVYTNSFLQAIPPQLCAKNIDGNVQFVTTDKLCPLRTPEKCKNCNCTSLSILTGKECILVTIKGRFEVFFPQYKCLECFQIEEVDLNIILQSGFFPSRATISSGMYIFSQELLMIFDKMRKESPSLSVRSFTTTYGNFSEDKGRCGRISQTAFSDAVREWRYLNYGISLVEEKSGFECPSCFDHIYAYHCDGNRKLYRYSYNSNQCEPSYYGNVFIEDNAKVDTFVKKVMSSKTEDGGDYCGPSHWKAMKSVSKTMSKFDETGLVMSCCRHNILLKAVNMFRGEIYAYPLYLQYNTTVPVTFVCQDVICKYWPYINRLADKLDDERFSSLTKSKPFLSVMHAKAHSISCQIEYGGRFQSGSGLTSGEEMEQTNSYMSRAGFITKSMSKHGREEELTELALSWNNKKIKHLRSSLLKRFLKLNSDLPKLTERFQIILETLGVSKEEVVTWRTNLGELIQDTKGFDESTLTGPGKLYLLHIRKQEVESLSSMSIQDDNYHLLPDMDRELLDRIKKASGGVLTLSDGYNDLVTSLQKTNTIEQLLEIGRKEVLQIRITNIQNLIEMVDQSIKQKIFDRQKVKDSGKKRNRLDVKIRKEKQALDKHVTDYNNLLQLFKVQECKLITQEMQRTSVWPWSIQGEKNFTNKKEAIDALNLLERTNEEAPMLKKEMESYCRYLLQKVQALQHPKYSGPIEDCNGAYAPSDLCPILGINSIRKRRCSVLKDELKTSIKIFKQCVEDFSSTSLCSNFSESESSDSESHSDSDTDSESEM